MRDLLCSAALVSVLVAGCSRDKPAPPVKAGLRVDVQVPPGESNSTGTYTLAITFPDGRAQQLAGERAGSINGRWVVDLGSDGIQDIVVWMASVGSGSYGVVHWYALQGTQFARRQLPDLAPEQKAGYQGHDTFEVVDGILHRSFPKYGPNDPNSSPSGGNVHLHYEFGRNSWVTD